MYARTFGLIVYACLLVVAARAYPDGEKIVEDDDDNGAKITYRGSQLWKVITEDDNDKKIVLARLRDNSDISMWGGDLTHLDVLVKNQSLNVVGDELRANAIDYDVIIDDLQRAIDEANPPLTDEDDELQIRQGHRLTWKAYHRLEDIYGYLDYLSETYPSLCTVTSIGRSVLGRELRVLKISNGAVGNKAIWIDGGIHAREWISPATVTYIINHLVLNYERESSNLQNLDWYFLPVANPDGYEYSHVTDRLWRKNRNRSGATCFGTDLNRNYGYRWGGKGSGRNPCQEIYGGTGPFSEPETESIRNFVTAQKANWKASVSFHSYGQFILYPWGYDKLVPPDFKDLQTVAQRAAAAINAVSGASYRTGPAGNTLYPASGGSDDWAKGAIGMKYAYTIELRDQGRYGFVLPAVYIEPTAKEALAALKVIAEAASLA